MARIFELTTPLGKDVLLFRALHGREELARLSDFDISAVSTRPDIGPGDLLGKSLTVKVELRSSGRHRYFNGYVTRFAQGGMVGRYYEYRFTVRPWLWFLTRTADCRIFQQKTVPEIIKEVFADHKVAVFEETLTGKYSRREYCVQYRETDFDFVSRLMEEEGIYYYLDHQDGRHTLKLIDSESGHEPLDNKATIAYYPPHRESHSDEEYIHAWTFAQSIKPGSVALKDYDFTKPKADLNVKAKVVQKHEGSEYEIFDWPGEYFETDDGDHYVRARIDELHAEFERGEAECNVREIAVGRLFTLTNAPRRDQELEYLIVSAQYELRDNAYETSPEDVAAYHCSFTVLPRRQQFRPARITPRPIVKGPQTAVVVGPAGEEIWTDKYGRVKVKFRWDRDDNANENSSCWIRVAQNVSGKGWGMVFIPRIGQEIIVDFEEGDADRPIIIGAFYNAQAMPPYPPTEHKTKTVLFKSNSSPGSNGFNEIRIEDKKDDEQVFIHGEKDLDVRIKHDRREWIGRDRHLIVKRDKIEEVDRDEHIDVKRDLVEEVGRDHHLTIDGKQAISVTGSHSLQVTGNVVEKFTASHSEDVTLNYSVKGMNVVLEGLTGLTIRVAGSFITLTPAGVQIMGPTVLINSGGVPLMAPPLLAVSPMPPLAAEIADKAEPGSMDDTQGQQRAATSPGDQASREAGGNVLTSGGASQAADLGRMAATTYRQQRAAMSPGDQASKEAPWHDPTTAENKQKKHWIEIELVDEQGKPVPGERYKITLPDGTTLAEGTLDEKGFARVDGIDPGTCKVTFPNLDKTAWRPA